MPPRNRAKLGLTIPVNPRSRGSFDASYSNNTALISPSTAPPAGLPSPSRRTADRSPRPPTIPPPPPPAPTRRKTQAEKKKTTTTTEAAELEREDTEKLESLVNAPPFGDSKRTLSKQLSMREMSSSSARDIAWEKRRRQNIRKERRRNSISVVTPAEEPYQPIAAGAADAERLTDADLHDLKGSIELGFGFNEEEGGQKLCNTLPALDLYFAVNRTLTASPVKAPHPPPMPLIRIPSAPQIRMQTMSPVESPRSDQDSWKIGGPAAGDDPQQVKIKLRHWAQAVACSIIQSS